MDWTTWCLVGFLFLTIELVTMGSVFSFYLVFLGISALGTGFILLLGDWYLPIPFFPPLWAQLMNFSIGSLLAMWLLQHPLQQFLSRPDEITRPIDSLIGNHGMTLQDLIPNHPGRVEIRGSSWNAMLDDSTPLPAGMPITVTRVEDLTLWVRATQPAPIPLCSA